MSQWQVLVGDVREKLATLPDASVQTCVTSPPYWGLRDYGTASWEGGEAGCEHIGDTERLAPPGTPKQARNRGTRSVRSGDCAFCGARRIDAQIGLEPTPHEYVGVLVSVFQEVWRVLKPDGTLWLNLGDSYQNAKGQAGGVDPKQPARRHLRGARPNDVSIAGLKPKDLVGIPWRVAFALQECGWYLRSDIIWSKPNPMPESVTDRPTKAHEYIFLLSKNERYFYDADAIAERTLSLDPSEPSYRPNSAVIAEFGRKEYHAKHEMSARVYNQTRNARSVWTVTTQPYPDAHFATFPEAIPEKCIKAGSKLGDTVLDPFCGSGTTGQVAIQLGRDFIGIELNPTYAQLARTRIGGAAPLFASEASA